MWFHLPSPPWPLGGMIVRGTGLHTTNPVSLRAMPMFALFPCQVKVARFFCQLYSSFLLPLPDLNCKLEIAVFPAGPYLQSRDRSGRRRTRTASPRSKWSLPDPNRKFRIGVVSAGPEQQAPDRMSQVMADRM